MFSLQACSSIDNKYIGRLPELCYEMYTKNRDRDNYSKEYKRVAAEKNRLKGTKMRCESQSPEIFEVIDNTAIATSVSWSSFVYCAWIRMKQDIASSLDIEVHYCDSKSDNLYVSDVSVHDTVYRFSTADHLLKGGQYPIYIEMHFEFLRNWRYDPKTIKTEEYRRYWKNLDRLSLYAILP